MVLITKTLWVCSWVNVSILTHAAMQGTTPLPLGKSRSPLPFMTPGDWGVLVGQRKVRRVYYSVLRYK